MLCFVVQKQLEKTCKWHTLNEVQLQPSLSIHMCQITFTQDGYSALMKAAYMGRTEVVVELVKAGADLNLQNNVCQHSACVITTE